MGMTLNAIAVRDQPLTEAEEAAITALLVEFDPWADIEGFHRDAPGAVDFESWGDFYGDLPENTVFSGSTRVPASSWQAADYGTNHWGHMLGRIRTDVLPNATWEVDVEGEPLGWVEASSRWGTVNGPDDIYALAADIGNTDGRLEQLLAASVPSFDALTSGEGLDELLEQFRWAADIAHGMYPCRPYETLAAQVAATDEGKALARMFAAGKHSWQAILSVSPIWWPQPDETTSDFLFELASETDNLADLVSGETALVRYFAYKMDGGGVEFTRTLVSHWLFPDASSRLLQNTIRWRHVAHQMIGTGSWLVDQYEQQPDLVAATRMIDFNEIAPHLMDAHDITEDRAKLEALRAFAAMAAFGSTAISAATAAALIQTRS